MVGQNNPEQATVVDAQDRAPSPEEIAAKVVGLLPDQVRRAVEEYRAACMDIENEPEWTAQTHISGKDYGIASYVSDQTAVMLTIENWKERGEWRSGRSFSFRGRPFEQFAEARAVELETGARFRLHFDGGEAVHDEDERPDNSEQEAAHD